MDMPTPCPHCGEVCEFNDMIETEIELNVEVFLCDECAENAEEEKTKCFECSEVIWDEDDATKIKADGRDVLVCEICFDFLEEE
ncbi:hypothetical protein [Salinivibrio kushneri]|uniref:ClpX-type ZB domain-containing protein n=1 Tax=Salinivibrio kushneri TaxID=1908198 RepID=A0AB36KAZ2_9GAMM|nr:hypothetical protein [Salinivibrio kushneri]OOE45106.1 hypothetical protein BZG09_05215 [Salinivibrio kushneri]